MFVICIWYWNVAFGSDLFVWFIQNLGFGWRCWTLKISMWSSFDGMAEGGSGHRYKMFDDTCWFLQWGNLMIHEFPFSCWLRYCRLTLFAVSGFCSFWFCFLIDCCHACPYYFSFWYYCIGDLFDILNHEERRTSHLTIVIGQSLQTLYKFQQYWSRKARKSSL